MTFRPPPAERLSIAGPAGALEALIEAESGGAPVAYAVICHPHPLYGGTLDNKVVHTLARAFQERGAATVRFNFRGVGQSDGAFGEGAGETADASAVVGWGARRWPGAPLWLAGFSFGGAVAIHTAAESHPALLVTVAPAVQRADPRVAPSLTCPWLILQGDADEVVAPRDVEAWAAQYAPGAKLIVMPGAGHYFHGRLPELREAVGGFVASAQKKSPAGS